MYTTSDYLNKLKAGKLEALIVVLETTKWWVVLWR